MKLRKNNRQDLHGDSEVGIKQCDQVGLQCTYFFKKWPFPASFIFIFIFLMLLIVKRNWQSLDSNHESLGSEATALPHCPNYNALCSNTSVTQKFSIRNLWSSRNQVFDYLALIPGQKLFFKLSSKFWHFVQKTFEQFAHLAK